MSDTTLEQVYEKYKHMTDKGTLHSYIPLYERMFAECRNRIARVLEIGVQSGGSLLLWRDYFPYAEVHGIDLNDCPRVANEERIHFHKINAANRGAIETALGVNRFDIIIDDASHKIEEQLFSMACLWGRLVPGGWYIVEDVLNRADLIRFAPMGESSIAYDLELTSHKYADRIVVIRKAW